MKYIVMEKSMEDDEEFLDEEDIVHIIPLYDNANDSSEVTNMTCGVSEAEGRLTYSLYRS